MQNEVTHYTTLGLMIGLEWSEARRIAAEIVQERHAGSNVDIDAES